MTDQWGAFCHPRMVVDPLGKGPLDGLAFAVKDVFDIEGYVCGAGSPDWKRTHGPADRHAEVVALLLAGGAKLAGMTHTDELMFSLNGENYHYGTPNNPKAVRHIPGGSSSGSAVAVAAGLVDFALGTDTGGSVRVPASYCGIYGIRPTHEAVPVRGVIPLAPSFDTVGWFANDPQTLLAVGRVLLKGMRDDAGGRQPFRRFFVGNDLFAVLEPDDERELAKTVRKLFTAVSVTPQAVTVAEEGLEEWMRVFRRLQGAEIWQTHGEWVRTAMPRFGPGIAERFSWSRSLQDSDMSGERAARHNIRARMLELLGDDGLLVLPTAAGTAPLRNTRGAVMEAKRNRTLMISCVSGLAGLPQVTMPWASVGGLPLGLSFVAAPGHDLRLLRFVDELARTTGLACREGTPESLVRQP